MAASPTSAGPEDNPSLVSYKSVSYMGESTVTYVYMHISLASTS